MSTRADRAATRRRAWHEAQIKAARTTRERFWRAASWLLAEALRRGRLDDATDAVLAKVHEMREEARA